MKYKLKLLFFFLLLPALAVAQEELKSEVEEYYDFLSLSGAVERPYLNFRTLSDSDWKINENTNHIWQGVNLAGRHPITKKMAYKVYGPKLFMSVNSASPYGVNDKALWQGKGFNLDFDVGARFECYGFEFTLKPELSFSQNMSFAYKTPAYSGNAAFKDKADTYGYYGIPSIDAPQRFGHKPFFTYDWGDTEVRYSYKTFTVGFGTQHIWLGPAHINPILHSNNAPPYPKFDIGMRKQPVILGKWNGGYMEFRTWWGMLEESKYFDVDKSNDNNLITGLTFSYSPSFIPGFTVGINRIMLSKWKDKDWKSIFTLLIPFMKDSAGTDDRDQRASITFDYLFSSIGLDVYLEWGRNDFSPSIAYVMRYPFHTQGYTVGLKKTFRIISQLKGEILLEHTNVEASADYLTNTTRLADSKDARSAPTTFYAHHRITQGHTNKGQWLGPGIGTGGNSQYLGIKLFYPKGMGTLFFQRVNPDNDFTWFKDIVDNFETAQESIRTNFSVGINGLYYITKDLWLKGQFVFIKEYNPTYRYFDLSQRFNTSTSVSIQYVY